MTNADLDALVEHRRAEWWHGAPRRALTPAVHPYGEVHHTGAASHYGKNPALVLEQIETQHRSRGWNGIFYGVFVPTDGSVWEARGVGWRSIGDHAPTYEDGTPVDPDALTILLPGDYRTNQVTPAQTRTLERIRLALPDDRLRWHGMRKPFTECPGTHTIATLTALNAHPPTLVEGFLMALTDQQQADLYEWANRLHRVFVGNRYVTTGENVPPGGHDLATPILHTNALAGMIAANQVTDGDLDTLIEVLAAGIHVEVPEISEELIAAGVKRALREGTD